MCRKTPVIGILSLQGDFAEHQDMLQRAGAESRLVKRAEEVEKIDGLVIPGGESTTIARLTERASDTIFDTIVRRAQSGMPIYGTCMGSIFLAREIEGSTQGRLALMDIKVRRNAFGSQKFSSERQIDIPVLGAGPFNVVFIRAPIVLSCGPDVQVLAKVDEGIIMARQGSLLVTSFHPELTEDLRVHEYFLEMVVQYLADREPQLANQKNQVQRATMPPSCSACDGLNRNAASLYGRKVH
jgi:5'-phosphate synthase pdxT subunit